TPTSTTFSTRSSASSRALSSSLYPYPALSLPTEIFQPMVMLLRVDVRRGGGASADARRGHSSPSLTATPARPVFFQYAGRTRPDSLTDLDRPRRVAAIPTRPRRPRKALSGLDRCVIGVLSFQNPDNATVDDEGPPRRSARGPPGGHGPADRDWCAGPVRRTPACPARAPGGAPNPSPSVVQQLREAGGHPGEGDCAGVGGAHGLVAVVAGAALARGDVRGGLGRFGGPRGAGGDHLGARLLGAGGLGEGDGLAE